MQDVAVGERQVGQDVLALHHPLDWQHGQRRSGRVLEVQARRALPGAQHLDVGEAEGDELGDFGGVLQARDDLEAGLQLGQRLLRLLERHRLVLVGHGARGEVLRGVLEGADERVVVDAHQGVGALLREAPDLSLIHI